MEQIGVRLILEKADHITQSRRLRQSRIPHWLKALSLPVSSDKLLRTKLLKYSVCTKASKNRLEKAANGKKKHLVAVAFPFVLDAAPCCHLALYETSVEMTMTITNSLELLLFHVGSLTSNFFSLRAKEQ
jgi:hypothetical protein